MASSDPDFHLSVLKQWILSKTSNNPWVDQIRSHLDLIPSDQDPNLERVKAENWHDWAIQQSALRVVRVDVPDDILPGSLKGQIIDVKVFCKHGPDDDIYDNNEDFRNKVARGNCLLEVNDGSEYTIFCMLQAMKKFTGGLGDDDDREKGDNYTWKKYFTKPMDAAKIVIAMKKANGEAAHLSCRHINGEFLLCGGSKNVHMIFRKKADICHYSADRFRIAREICETVMDMLDSLNEEIRQRLLHFLALTRYTAVFEILSPNHQHIVDLTHLKQSELKFITWTKSELDPSDEDLLSIIPVHIGIELARVFGLKTVDYDVVKISNLEDRMKQIRMGYQYEGEVIYFMDSSQTVIGLLKKKTVWYIVCRAIREKLRPACMTFRKSPSTFSISRVLNKMERRIDEIQVWLGLNMETVLAWKHLSGKFIRWAIHQQEKEEQTVEDVVDKFPVIWRTYLEQSGETDHFQVECMEPS